MTVIAAIRGVGMAADTRATFDDATHYDAPKIFRVRDGLLGIAGDADACIAFLDWFRDKRRSKPDDMDDDFEALFLSDKTLEYWSEKFNRTVLDNDFYAIGCGKLGALSALEYVSMINEPLDDDALVTSILATCEHNAACGVKNGRVNFEALD